MIMKTTATEKHNKIREVELSYSYDMKSVKREKISSSKDAYQYLSKAYNKNTIGMQEEFMAVLLNKANKPLGVVKLTKGGIDSTIIDIRLLMAAALKSLSCGIIITHNHPSGEVKPSQSDIAITKKVKEAGKLLDIPLLDHLIVTPFGQYFSFADEGLMT